MGTAFVGEASGMLSELEIGREGSRVGSGLRARVGLPCTNHFGEQNSEEV